MLGRSDIGLYEIVRSCGLHSFNNIITRPLTIALRHISFLGMCCTHAIEQQSLVYAWVDRIETRCLLKLMLLSKSWATSEGVKYLNFSLVHSRGSEPVLGRG